MRIIAIASQKGGVAKSTTAVQLATGLALKGHPTLLIDMDPQANATYSVFGEEADDNSVYDLLMRDVPLSSVVRRTQRPNLDMVPSNIELAGAEVELISKVGGQRRLRAKLDKSASTLGYEYVIIDAPPSLGFLTINTLAAATEVIIPVPASVFALKGIKDLEETIADVRQELGNDQLRVMGVLCTIFEPNTNVARDVRKTIQDHFGELVFRASIPKTVKFEEAHSRQLSIFEHAPESAAAEQYRLFVEEVINRGKV